MCPFPKETAFEEAWLCYCRVKSGISYQSATDVVYPPKILCAYLGRAEDRESTIKQERGVVKPLKASYLPVFPVIALRKTYPSLSRKSHTHVRDLA